MIESHIRGLLDAATSVAADSNLPDVLRRTVRSACELVDARYGALGVLGPDRKFSEFITVGVDRAERQRIGKLPTGHGILGLLIADPRSRRLADLRKHPAAYGFPPGHPRMRSFLGVPIRVRETVFGNLYLTEKRGNEAFTDQDEELVVALAAAVGVTIENAILFDKARRRERWLEASHQVTSALLVGGEPNTTFRLIAERARVVAGASVAAIARPRAGDRSTLVFEVVEAEDPREQEQFAGVTVPAEGTAIGLAFTSARPVVIRQYGDHVLAQQTGSATQLPAMVKDLDSAVAVPLTVGDETLGVLLVAKFRDSVAFTDADVQLVQTFAGHAALALQFSRAEEDRRRLAVFEDRDRIARDLHDLVIQRLFATGLGLEGLSRLIVQPEVAERMTAFVHDLDRTIRDVRNSIFSLREPAEPRTSLRSELLGLALESTEVLGFEPRISFDGPLDTLVPDRVRGDLIATLREALSNAGRHAMATSVSADISVDRQGRQLTVTVTDDGVGIPDAPVRSSGLANLAERAARWNGTLSVQRTGERGTKLAWTVDLPVQTESER